MSQNSTDNMNNNLLNQYIESKRIIRQAMDDYQLVLFVGAGASIASGIDLLAELLALGMWQSHFIFWSRWQMIRRRRIIMRRKSQIISIMVFHRPMHTWQ